MRVDRASVRGLAPAKPSPLRALTALTHSRNPFAPRPVKIGMLMLQERARWARLVQLYSGVLARPRHLNEVPLRAGALTTQDDSGETRESVPRCCSALLLLRSVVSRLTAWGGRGRGYYSAVIKERPSELRSRGGQQSGRLTSERVQSGAERQCNALVRTALVCGKREGEEGQGPRVDSLVISVSLAFRVRRTENEAGLLSSLGEGKRATKKRKSRERGFFPLPRSGIGS